MTYSSPLAQAIAKKDLTEVREIIEAAQNPNHLLSDPEYLGIAVENSTPEIVLFLIQAGADINGWIDGENTVLMAAAYGGNLEMTRVLVEQGADPNLINPGGESAIFIAAYGGHVEVFNYLVGVSNEDLRVVAEEQLEEGIARREEGDKPYWQKWDSLRQRS